MTSLEAAGNDRRLAQRTRRRLARNEHALRSELAVSGTQTVQTLQRTETHIAAMNDLLSNQNQQYTALRSELLSGEAEALRVLQRIESHIGKVVENEIERVVQSRFRKSSLPWSAKKCTTRFRRNRTENS